MGCDIHLHVEIKVDGKWLHYNHPDIDRSYDLFGLMASVRGCGPAIADPRGIPPDATETTLLHYNYDMPDAHTPSWLGVAEVAIIERSVARRFPDKPPFGYLFGGSWGGFHEYPGDRPPFLQDARVVFWFDN